MRIINRTVKSTPLQWLPVISNIKLSHIRRKDVLIKIIKKSEDQKHSLLYQMLLETIDQRLKSRISPVETARKLTSLGFDIAEEWRKEWASFTTLNGKQVFDPNNGVLGMNPPRSTWSTLTRLRTSHGQCGALLHNWRFPDNPACDCRNGEQTINHTVAECQNRKFNQGLKACILWPQKT